MLNRRAILRIVVVGLLLSGTAMATQSSPQLTLQTLQETQSTDPQAWRLLAIEAREAGVADIAAMAIQRAAELGLPAVSVGFERARQFAVAGDKSAAVGELQLLVDTGFSAVQAITGDPVLAKLGGDPEFDALVSGMAVSAFPCAHQERFRAFDFWLGKWDVHLENGTLAGTNSIRAEQQGCVLIEEWAGVGGSTGHSINFLDAATGDWVQYWNDAGGSQIAIRGGLTDEGMLLTGQIHYVATNTTLPFRGLWTPLPDGRVRQYFEQSTDAGATWTPWFEGFYSRREAQDTQ